MIFEKGYTFKKVKTSHGSEMYVSRFDQVVKVIPCSTQTLLSDTYVHSLIQQIESMN
jgi:hypothetical protein